jgi:hypothetical protein
MISILRIVLGYQVTEHPSELYAGLLALSFCNSLPTDFKGPVRSVVDKFRDNVKSGMGDVTEPLKTDPDRMYKLRGIKGIISAVRDSWAALGTVKVMDKSKWYSNDVEYRSFLLVKAFVDEFRDMAMKIGGTVPPTASLNTLWNVTSTDTPVDNNRVLYKVARKKFEDVPIKKSKDKPTEGKPTEGKPTEGKPTQTEDKPVAPSKDDAKVTTPEPEKKKSPGGTQPGTRLDKSIQTLKSIDTTGMAQSDKDKLSDLITKALRFYNQEKSTRPVPVKTAGLGDALSKLVEFIRPVFKSFLRKAREVPEMPVEELVWKDPDRLHEVLSRMDSVHREAVLRQTEKILGILLSI